MKKKTVILIIVAICAVCLAAVIAFFSWRNCSASKSGGEQNSKHVHEYGELIPEQPATCTEEGMQAHYYCSGCQTYFDGEKNVTTLEDLKIGIDSTAHNYGELVPQVDAQCEVAGTKAYYHCEDCGKYFDDQKVETEYENLNIPAKDHNYGQLVPQVDAQCEVAGTKAYYHCEDCGKYFDDQKVETEYENLNIPAKDHNYGQLVPQVDAQCEVAGTKAYYHCEDCGKYFDDQKVETEYENLNIPAKDHNYGELVPEQPATCTDEGLEAHFHCENCGKYFNSSQVETDYEDLKIGVNPNAHKWQISTTESNKKECSVCGTTENIYSKSSDGTKIYFGEYPQSEVTESGLKATLGWEAGNGTLPTAGNANGWTDYNYYISGKVQSFMWYIDIEYGNARYRGVYFTSYRPHVATYSSSTDNTRQDDNGYLKGTAYWFKYEPIEWRILEQKDGTALLMSNIILDSQQFYHEEEGTRTIGGKAIYPNNYKESDIRAWLNSTFYNVAFDKFAKSIIQKTIVDNSTASIASSSSSKYACENTSDNIFLLSYKDIINSSYGFSSSATYDTARQLKSTAYAKSQGVNVSSDSSYKDNGWWWLRSPDLNVSDLAYRIFISGDGDRHTDVNYTVGGVVPAIWIKL